MHPLQALVARSPARLCLPVAVYPGVALTGARVVDVVTDPQAQADAALALQQRFRMPAVLSAMDLSVEAEAFGCPVQFSDQEIPTVIERLVTSPEAGEALAVPEPGAARTSVYLETVRRLRQAAPAGVVLGCCIGPFSLASRLLGMSETLGWTLTDPAALQCVLEKAAAFLTGYVQAFKAAGADGLLMAEPGAGLLSPKAMALFSSAYIRRIVTAVEDARFGLVLHNCAARIVHLPALLESGAQVYHFSVPMDLPAALARVPREVVLCGNLDPTEVFFQSTPAQVGAATRRLLAVTAAFPQFILSSGCDVPAGSPLANLEAFFAAAAAG